MKPRPAIGEPDARALGNGRRVRGMISDMAAGVGDIDGSYDGRSAGSGLTAGRPVG
ncbi:MAG: hypothetical protein LBR77_06880 [Lachnospiraceae bacterium]|jgi:hypothetical protein|nr:hypothetical protein [Lachnospiraceae bacterium]